MVRANFMPRSYGLIGLLAIVAVAAALAAVPRSAAAFEADELFAPVVAVIPDWKTRPQQGGHLLAPEGTAVAVLKGGLLATNVHVVRDAETATLRFASGRLARAEVVARDARTDLALLKTDVEIAPVDVAEPPVLGGRVCAVGNYFGQGLSVTCGVVSAVRRTATGFNAIEDFIQTDATVNPGGSGGALVDGDGRFVGLVSAIFTKSSDADIGMNFAASAELVLRVAEDLAAHGAVRWGDAGMVFEDLSTPELFQDTGARVAEVTADGPALAAGVDAGDVVVEIDDRPIHTAADARTALALKRPGEPVEVVFHRAQQLTTVELILRK